MTSSSSSVLMRCCTTPNYVCKNCGEPVFYVIGDKRYTHIVRKLCEDDDVKEKRRKITYDGFDYDCTVVMKMKKKKKITDYCRLMFDFDLNEELICLSSCFFVSAWLLPCPAEYLDTPKHLLGLEGSVAYHSLILGLSDSDKYSRIFPRVIYRLAMIMDDFTKTDLTKLAYRRDYMNFVFYSMLILVRTFEKHGEGELVNVYEHVEYYRFLTIPQIINLASALPLDVKFPTGTIIDDAFGEDVSRKLGAFMLQYMAMLRLLVYLRSENDCGPRWSGMYKAKTGLFRTTVIGYCDDHCILCKGSALVSDQRKLWTLRDFLCYKICNLPCLFPGYLENERSSI